GVDALLLGPLLEALGAGAALRIAERRIGGRVHHERAGGVAVGLCRGLEELVEPVADRGEIVLGQRSRLGVLALLGGGVAVRVARVLALVLGGALGLLSGLRPLLGGALALLGGGAVGLGGVVLGVGTVLGGALLDGRAVVLLLVPAGEAAACRGTGHDGQRPQRRRRASNRPAHDRRHRPVSSLGRPRASWRRRADRVTARRRSRWGELPTPRHERRVRRWKCCSEGDREVPEVVLASHHRHVDLLVEHAERDRAVAVVARRDGRGIDRLEHPRRQELLMGCDGALRPLGAVGEPLPLGGAPVVGSSTYVQA